MSKVCIIGSANLINISLISIYTTFFDKRNIDYDLIYWDRLNLNERSTASNVYKFTKPISKRSILSKARDYYHFRRFIYKIISGHDYDLLITWQTSIGYLLADKLLTSYRHRYVLNIRDYIAERRFGFNLLIRLLTRFSTFNTISSKGFLSFLPDRDYKLIQSVNEDLVDGLDKGTKTSGKIKIGFVGSCRYFAESKKFIDNLANDDRFELWFCGSNSEVLKQYAESKKYENVHTIGRFKREETISIIRKMNLINSCFGSDTIANKTLVPIRLFSAISQGIPVLASSNTYLEKLLIDNKIGLGVDVTNVNLGDVISIYYKNLVFDEFYNNSSVFLNAAISTNREFENYLDHIVKAI